MPPDLSIVIPIYCEQENLPELYRRLCAALDPLPRTYEIVFVNDCSHDESLEIMRDLHRRDAKVRVVSLSRNFGHQVAITAGMRHARGESVILMDGDLQDPPEVLPELIRKREEGGWDIVYAIRRQRKEPLLNRLLYYCFYRLLRQSSYINIPVDAGDFCIMSRRVVDALNAMPERNRFVRGLRSWVGFRQTGMEYERAARASGEPKYRLKSLIKLAFDGIFSFSYLPLRISTFLGILLSFCGLFYAAIVIIRRLRGDFVAIQGWSTVVVSVLVLGGAQLIILGIIGEYLGRVYDEIKGRPAFLIDELIGFEQGEESKPSSR